MNGVAIVIYVNMTMSCLYQNVPYMYSKYPLLWTIENKKGYRPNRENTTIKITRFKTYLFYHTII